MYLLKFFKTREKKKIYSDFVSNIAKKHGLKLQNTDIKRIANALIMFDDDKEMLKQVLKTIDMFLKSKKRQALMFSIDIIKSPLFLELKKQRSMYLYNYIESLASIKEAHNMTNESILAILSNESIISVIRDINNTSACIAMFEYFINTYYNVKSIDKLEERVRGINRYKIGIIKLYADLVKSHRFKDFSFAILGHDENKMKFIYSQLANNEVYKFIEYLINIDEEKGAEILKDFYTLIYKTTNNESIYLYSNDLVSCLKCYRDINIIAIILKELISAYDVHFRFNSSPATLLKASIKRLIEEKNIKKISHIAEQRDGNETSYAIANTYIDIKTEIKNVILGNDI